MCLQSSIWLSFRITLLTCIHISHNETRKYLKGQSYLTTKTLQNIAHVQLCSWDRPQCETPAHFNEPTVKLVSWQWWWHRPLTPIRLRVQICCLAGRVSMWFLQVFPGHWIPLSVSTCNSGKLEDKLITLVNVSVNAYLFISITIYQLFAGIGPVPPTLHKIITLENRFFLCQISF